MTTLKNELQRLRWSHNEEFQKLLILMRETSVAGETTIRVPKEMIDKGGALYCYLQRQGVTIMSSLRKDQWLVSW